MTKRLNEKDAVASLYCVFFVYKHSPRKDENVPLVFKPISVVMLQSLAELYLFVVWAQDYEIFYASFPEWQRLKPAIKDS